MLLLVLAASLVPLAIPGETFERSLFLATFTGVPDGPGDGRSFPAEVGAIAVFTADGRPLDQVAPFSGIAGERLLLTDKSGDSAVDFGVDCHPLARSDTGSWVSFELRLEQKGTAFSVDITDVTGIDVMRIGVQPDGKLLINDSSSGTGAAPGIDYRVDQFLSRVGNRYFVVVTDLTNGVVLGSWSGVIPGGYRAIDVLTFRKLGGSRGSFTLDNVRIDPLK